MALGTSIVPIMDAIAKVLGDSMSPLQITWGRFLFQFLIMGTALIIMSGYKTLIPKKPATHIIRGLFLATATTFFFWGLQHLPLANAIAIFFVQPMILTVLSAVLLGEKIGWHRRIAVVTGFIGTLLIIKPGTDAFSLAALLPLAAAFFFACYIALTRAVANIDHAATMQFASGLAAAIALTFALWIASFWPDSGFAPSVATTTEWFWLFVIGIVAAAGHLLVVMGVNRAPASALAPLGYVEIIAATILGWFVFKELPDALTWLGIAIIVVSGIYVFSRENAVHRAST